MKLERTDLEPIAGRFCTHQSGGADDKFDRFLAELSYLFLIRPRFAMDSAYLLVSKIISNIENLKSSYGTLYSALRGLTYGKAYDAETPKGFEGEFQNRANQLQTSSFGEGDKVLLSRLTSSVNASARDVAKPMMVKGSKHSLSGKQQSWADLASAYSIYLDDLDTLDGMLGKFKGWSAPDRNLLAKVSSRKIYAKIDDSLSMMDQKADGTTAEDTILELASMKATTKVLENNTTEAVRVNSQERPNYPVGSSLSFRVIAPPDPVTLSIDQDFSAFDLINGTGPNHITPIARYPVVYTTEDYTAPGPTELLGLSFPGCPAGGLGINLSACPTAAAAAAAITLASPSLAATTLPWDTNKLMILCTQEYISVLPSFDGTMGWRKVGFSGPVSCGQEPPHELQERYISNQITMSNVAFSLSSVLVLEALATSLGTTGYTLDSVEGVQMNDYILFDGEFLGQISSVDSTLLQITVSGTLSRSSGYPHRDNLLPASSKPCSIVRMVYDFVYSPPHADSLTVGLDSVSATYSMGYVHGRLNSDSPRQSIAKAGWMDIESGDVLNFSGEDRLITSISDTTMSYPENVKNYGGSLIHFSPGSPSEGDFPVKISAHQWDILADDQDISWERGTRFSEWWERNRDTDTTKAQILRGMGFLEEEAKALFSDLSFLDSDSIITPNPDNLEGYLNTINRQAPEEVSSALDQLHEHGWSAAEQDFLLGNWSDLFSRTSASASMEGDISCDMEQFGREFQFRPDRDKQASRMTSEPDYQKILDGTGK